MGARYPLVVLTSPYRSLLRPLLDYIDEIQARGEDQMITKAALLFRRNTVGADVPYHLKR